MIRRALTLSMALLLTTPALATDDTDSAVGEPSETFTAAELAGEPGGVDCSHVGSIGAASTAMLAALVLVARRRV